MTTAAGTATADPRELVNRGVPRGHAVPVRLLSRFTLPWFRYRGLRYRRSVVLPLFSLLVGLCPVTLPAQPATVLSVNPFLPLLGFFQGEVEHAVRDHLAVAVGVSHLALDDRLTNLDAKLRFYPQERAPAGLGLTAGLGIGHAREQAYLGDGTCTASGCPVPVPVTRNRFAPSVSVELHYQWLLGRTRRTAVGVGFGGKRYVTSGPIPDLVPTGRLTVGWAFGKR